MVIIWAIGHSYAIAFYLFNAIVVVFNSFLFCSGGVLGARCQENSYDDEANSDESFHASNNIVMIVVLVK